MTPHQHDLIRFLRLAGTESGIPARHISPKLIGFAAELGGRVRFVGDRIYITNSWAALRRLESITANEHPKAQ